MPFALAGTLLGLAVLVLEAANRVFGTYLRTPARAAYRVSATLAVLAIYALPAMVWVLTDGPTARRMTWATGALGPVLLALYVWPPGFGVRRAHSAEEHDRPLPPEARLRTVRLRPPAWPGDAPRLRVLALSDLHCNTPDAPARLARRAKAACRPEPPDLVLVPGDLGETDELLPQVLDALAALPSRYGTFLVMGNHDLEEGRDRLLPELAAGRDVVLLRNEIHALPEAGVAVAGLEVPWMGSPPEPDTDLPLLGLAHSPDAIFALARTGVQVAVCGHTHGGMLRPPLLGSMGVPSRLGRALAYGVFRLGPTHLVVTSGAGDPLPHTSTHPELVLLELG
jgi:predicted MPP superfamily phosphohydrolase